MKPQAKGMIYDEPNEVYHANKEHTSFSNLKTLINSPELFHKKEMGLIPSEHKDVFDIGSAVHDQILEPGKPSEYFLTDSTYKGTTKEGKEIKADCIEKGLTLINAANSEIVRSCVSAILISPANSLFNIGYPEVTFRVEGGGFKLQCRTDWICHEAPEGLEAFGIEAGERYVADLKTTQSLDDWLNDSQWKNPMTNGMFYAGQEQFYCPIIDTVLSSADMGRVDKWVFVVVEKKEPFRVAVIVVPENVKEWAKSRVNEALNDLISRNASGIWTDERLEGVYEPFIFVK